MDGNSKDINLVVHQHGVIMPPWLAIGMLAAFILACLTFLLTVSELKSIHAEIDQLRINEIDELRREIRMLQLHAQDIENVLIRTRAAERSDFAPWPNEPRKENRK